MTSLVQSAFFVIRRVTSVPSPALAALPAVATLSALTPRCCSTLRFSKTVCADRYSATSCWTRSRFSMTQLNSPVSRSRVTPRIEYSTPLDDAGRVGSSSTSQWNSFVDL